MTLKRIAMITMCVMLTITVVLGMVVFVRISPVVNALLGMGGGQQPTQGQPQSSVESSDSSSSQTPPSSEVPPTEDDHQHTFFLSRTHAATCDTVGYSIFACACGKTEIRDQVKALGHSYGAGKLVPATCEKGGYTLRKCSVCGHEEKRDLENPLDHDWVIIEEKEATCTECSYTKMECSRNGCDQMREIDGPAPVGHAYEIKEDVAVSCTQDGYTAYECSVCGDVVKENVIPMWGHSGDWVVTREPAAGDPGEESSTCTTCGDTQSRACDLTMAEPASEEQGDHVRYTVLVCAKDSQGQDVVVYTYTVLDYVMVGQVDFAYEEETGLLVSVTIDGQTDTYPLEPGNGTLTLPVQTDIEE